VNVTRFFTAIMLGEIGSNFMSQENQTRRLIPLTSWNSIHSYPPLGQLRNLVFNAEKTGFGNCIRRVGKRILIDEQKYFEWVDQQSNKQESGQ
jgi:hypothetical protein